MKIRVSKNRQRNLNVPGLPVPEKQISEKGKSAVIDLQESRSHADQFVI
jgi:hypothetical protein